MTEYHAMSDVELVRFAAGNAGAAGAGAMAELTRRDIEMQIRTRESLDALRDELSNSGGRMEGMTTTLVRLTLVLAVFTAVVVGLTAWLLYLEVA